MKSVPFAMALCFAFGLSVHAFDVAQIWLWGHDALSFRGTDLGKRLGERHLDIPDACARLGIPNACVVRWQGLPAEPFEAYCAKLSGLKSFGWSVADGDTTVSFMEKTDRVVALAEKFPKLTTVWLDGWFEVDSIRQPVSELVKLRKRLQALPQKPKLTVVFQSHEFDKNPKPDFDACDQISFWLWHASDIPHADDLFARCRALAGPDKPILIAITLWDMEKNKPLERGLMQAQLAFAANKLNCGEAAGLVVHCSPLADCDLESVSLLKDWIASCAGSGR